MIVHNEKEKDGDDRSPANPGSDLERASLDQDRAVVGVADPVQEVDIDNF
jgi:hypothetical protein